MTLSQTRSKSARKLLTALGVGVLGLFVLAARGAGESADYWLSWRAFALGLACLLPSFEHLLRIRREPDNVEPLPLLPVVGTIYGVFFALPLLLRSQPRFMGITPDQSSLSSALNLMLGGWCALLFGYYCLGRVGRIRAQAHFHMNTENAKRLAWPFVGIGLVCHLLWRAHLIPGVLAQPVLVLSWLLQVGVGMGVILALRGELQGIAKTAVYVLGVPALFAVRLGENGIGAFVFPGLYLLLLIWAVRASLPWRYAIPALFALMLVKGGVSEYRRALAASGEGTLSETERAGLMVEIMSERLESQGVVGSLEMAGRSLRDRTAIIALFAHVVSRTPHVVPHWNGSTYLGLPATVVPRFLWPDKPSMDLGHRFGHAYRILEPQDRDTSVNCPQVLELYINFGPFGVLFGMALMGFLYRLMVRWWSVPGADDGTLLVGALLFSRLFDIETDTTIVWGGMVQTAILMFFVFRFLRDPK